MTTPKTAPAGSIYTVGRLCALAAAPACLFIANNYFAQVVAVGLAVAFLGSNAAMAMVGADVHRRFYLRLFSGEQDHNGLSFYLYAASWTLLVALGSAAVLAIILRSTHSVPLAAAGVAFFVSEKLADEILRLRLFERNFTSWGQSATAVFVLHILALGLLLMLAGTAAHATVVVSIFAAGNFAVFVPQLPRGLGRNLSGRSPRLAIWLARRAARSIFSSRILWEISLLGTTIGYLDRLWALILDKRILPLFMLVVMCFSLLQISVDYYYVSQMRKDFLEKRISIGGAFMSARFLVSVVGGLVLASLACAAVLKTSKNGSQFPLTYIAAIAGLQLSFAGVAVPQQILYWHHRLRDILWIELAFWIVFASSALFAWRTRLSVSGMLSTVVCCCFARLGLYVGATVISKAAGTEVPAVPVPL